MSIDLDPSKLPRLQLDLVQLDAAARELSALRRDVGDGLNLAEFDLQRSCRWTQANHRPGDDLGAILNMPADERASKDLGSAYLLAQSITAKRAELANVVARLAVVDAQRSDLATLVYRCQKHIDQQQQGVAP